MSDRVGPRWPGPPLNSESLAAVYVDMRACLRPRIVAPGGAHGPGVSVVAHEMLADLERMARESHHDYDDQCAAFDHAHHVQLALGGILTSLSSGEAERALAWTEVHAGMMFTHDPQSDCSRLVCPVLQDGGLEHLPAPDAQAAAAQGSPNDNGMGSLNSGAAGPLLPYSRLPEQYAQMLGHVRRPRGEPPYSDLREVQDELEYFANETDRSSANERVLDAIIARTDRFLIELCNLLKELSADDARLADVAILRQAGRRFMDDYEHPPVLPAWLEAQMGGAPDA